MKKLLLILLVLTSYFASAQPGYTLINSRYSWLAGKFTALNLPVGSGPAALTAGQYTASGGIYLDTLGVDAGLYLYINGVWVLQGQGAAADLPDEFIVVPSVSWKGVGYQFHIQQGAYRIDNVVYASDSASFTLAASDPTDPRKDVVYVGTDGSYHILQGTPSPSAAEPQLDGDQLKVTVIDVPAGSTVPTLTQEVIYNENIEWTETHTSVTVDPNSTGNAWIGTKATNITNINHGDGITWTRPIGFVSVLNYQAISFSIDLKAILATTTNLRVSFFSSGIQVSNEVNINLNKNSLVYQANTIPMSQFTFSNYNVNAVRLRYTNSAGATVHTGFYVDYIHLVAGFSQPGGGGDFNYTLVMPSGFAVSPATVSNNGTHTVTGAGSTSQYIDGTGALRSFTAWNTQGAIDGVAKTAFGFGISGNIFYQQYADATYPGLLSALNWRRFDTAAQRTVTNGATGDTLAAFVDNYTTLIKSLKDSTGIGIIDRGDYLAIYATGGGGGGEKFGVSGEDDVAAEVRAFAANGFPFTISTDANDISFENADPGTFSNYIRLQGDGNIITRSDYLGTIAAIGVNGLGITLSQDNGVYNIENLVEPSGSTNKMVIWDSVSNRLYVTAISGGGGGGSGLFPTTGTGTATGNVTGNLDGNTLKVQQVGIDFLSIDPTNNAESSSLSVLNSTGDTKSASLQASSSSSIAQFVLIADYDENQTATIQGVVDNSTSTITHTADTHTFTGNVIAEDNFLIGGTSVATSATTTLHLFNGTAPSASITDGVLLYAQDNSSSSELKVRDEAGNVTTLSPHNFSGIGQKSEEMAWAYYSEKDGTYINVDMLKLVRLVEKLTGEKLVFIGKK